MKAMQLRELGQVEPTSQPLAAVECDPPAAGPGQVLLRVEVCGVCHTELDEIEGRTPPPELPVIPGHQAVGCVESLGDGVTSLKAGDRVGVGWIGGACGNCGYCRHGLENLCGEFRATGRDINGGYASTWW